MNNYRYTLEKYTGKNSRYTCPACGKEHRFTRYIDTHTGDHLSPEVGRCNREVKCGYHYKPKQYFEDNPLESQNSKGKTSKGTYPTPARVIASAAEPPRETPHTPAELSATLCDYEENHLVQYLIGKLGVAAVQKLLGQYRIGTHHHWRGSTVYWYIGRQGRICKGKVMQYNSHTGKRVKQPFPHVTWMHTLLDKEPGSGTCFFGEHLLSNTILPVCIVESEKTALIAAHHLPQSIWLATGGIGNLSVTRCKEVLSGRKLTLFPDAGGYDKWAAIAGQLPNCNITRIIDEFAVYGSDDLADLLCA